MLTFGILVPYSSGDRSVLRLSHKITFSSPSKHAPPHVTVPYFPERCFGTKLASVFLSVRLDSAVLARGTYKPGELWFSVRARLAKDYFQKGRLNPAS